MTDIKQAAFLCIERPSLVRFQDPFPVFLGLPKLGDGGTRETKDLWSLFTFLRLPCSVAESQTYASDCESITHSGKNGFF